jgi:hypothetical protein
MRAMPKSDPILAPETASVQGSSTTKVGNSSAERSGEIPSPQPSPGTGRGSDSPLPVRGEVAQRAGEGPSREFGGRDGPEPTRFGDWEKSGRCIDF